LDGAVGKGVAGRNIRTVILENRGLVTMKNRGNVETVTWCPPEIAVQVA
jgi:hypothetical protein